MKPLTKEEKQKVRELSNSIYDAWTNPPPLETLTNLFKREPRNFTTLSLAEIDEFVLSNLKKNDPLFDKLSEPTMKKLLFGIHKGYYGTNISDLANGGKGLIVPTFIEIMHTMIFWIRDNDYKELVVQADHDVFHKYFWCFETYSLLIAEAQMSRFA